MATAFNAGRSPSNLLRRRKTAVDQTRPPCDKNDLRRTDRPASFRYGVRVVRTRAGVGVSWPPSRGAFCPKFPKTSQVPGSCKAASVSRWFASHRRKSTATKARHRRRPAAMSRAIHDRNTRDPCARMQDETILPVSSLAAHRSAWTYPRESSPTFRGIFARAWPPLRAIERYAAGRKSGSLMTLWSRNASAWS
jgi:hypothetical protein